MLYYLYVIQLSLPTYALPIIANDKDICNKDKMSGVVKPEMRFVSGCLVLRRLANTTNTAIK